jgi:hypothetical protein
MSDDAEDFEGVTKGAFSMAENQMGQDLYQRQVKNAEANADLMSAHAERIRTLLGALNIIVFATIPFYIAAVIYVWKALVL